MIVTAAIKLRHKIKRRKMNDSLTSRNEGHSVFFMTTDKKATKANTLNDFNTGNWQKQLTLLFCLIVCARDTEATNKTGKKTVRETLT